jgi:hypothetical protein
MLEGTALIARQAAKKRAKENKKVVVHPAVDPNQWTTKWST